MTTPRGESPPEGLAGSWHAWRFVLCPDAAEGGPVHLASEVPEAAQPSVANTDPAGLRTPSDPAEPLPPGRTSVEAVGRDEQNAAVRWPDVLNALAAIRRFFIRFFGGV
jgi:hypothetical protein